MKPAFSIGLLLAMAILPSSLRAQEYIHHDLKIELHPEAHSLIAVDKVSLPKRLLKEMQFTLHKGLGPSSSTPGVRILRRERESGTGNPESFLVILPAGLDSFMLEYRGAILHAIRPAEKEAARGLSETPGLISREGVFLSGSSLWYPEFGDEMITFSLEIILPGKWDAVSQGERTLHKREKDKTTVRWESPEPQNEIFLIAAEYTEYARPIGKTTVMAFLRTADEGLATRYLNATGSYLDMYERLIGPYPYKKFALVENFWETGYGMPSFTLLGPKVIRLPFILNSSYPHEILHNWWGNGVFPDYGNGNWSEGLTAYLADHLIKEQKGEGIEYRREALQKYADYVLSERDFPLSQFISRHSSPSEAVGYGKSLMLFHMLRMELGDQTFSKGLQEFYLKNRFRSASFDDIRKSLEEVSGKDLKEEFTQWVTRSGAPQIRIRSAKALAEGNGYILSAIIEQVQPGPLFNLRIPVAVTMEGRDEAFQTSVNTKERSHELRILLPAYPLRLDVDPEFDLFRRLDLEETPPALTQALGSKKMLIILPSAADKGLLNAYRGLSKTLSQSGPDEVEVRLDTGVKKIPSDRAVTVIGWENHFLNDVKSALSAHEVVIDHTGVGIGKAGVPQENRSVVFTARNPENREVSLTWIATDLARAVPGLGRKLPHYHKYSYLIFEGEEPVNTIKERWPVLNSPLTAFIPDKDGKIWKVKMGRLAERKPLITLPTGFPQSHQMHQRKVLSATALSFPQAQPGPSMWEGISGLSD